MWLRSRHGLSPSGTIGYSCGTGIPCGAVRVRTTQIELIQWRSFVAVWRSPKNTCPKCDPQLEQRASTALPCLCP